MMHKKAPKFFLNILWKPHCSTYLVKVAFGKNCETDHFDTLAENFKIQVIIHSTFVQIDFMYHRKSYFCSNLYTHACTKTQKVMNNFQSCSFSGKFENNLQNCILRPQIYCQGLLD